MDSIIFQIIYITIIIGVVLRIVYDTQNTAKALTLILLVVFLPFVGVVAYFMFGVNLRKHKIFSKKLLKNSTLLEKIKSNSYNENKKLVKKNEDQYKKIISLILNENHCPLTDDNQVTLLVNGERKFPELLKALKTAKNHIHLEYYIYEDDKTGQSVAEILIEKARAGVEVRFIYDDLGSRSIKSKMVPRLKEAGVEVYPFYEIKYLLLANRINYRNHRKITVIDGHTAFIGGINVGDEYVNEKGKKDKLFWRDSHLLVKGSCVYYLQYLFISDWNYCSIDKDDLHPSLQYFPKISPSAIANKLVQIAASGPDSDTASVMHSILQAINLAKTNIEITTPYFVPNESIMDGLCIASRSGITIKLLVPCKSDSKLVDAASEFYFERLLKAGVEIFLYNKGFVHSKSIVIDDCITILGTANMDVRSFELNFEVNAVVYDKDLAIEMRDMFSKDLKDATIVNLERWENRSIFIRLKQSLARLFSPIL